jgi:hypothetical protein
MQPDNSTESLVQLLQQLRVPVTRRSVYEELGKHPDHPSLLAFSDVLRTWGVPNSAYRLAPTELANVPIPFLVHLATHGGEFRLVESMTTIEGEGALCLPRPAGFTPEEFNKAFTGNVLLAEAQSGAGELHYRQNRRQERVESLRVPFILASCLALSGLLLYQSAWLAAATWHLALLIVAKSAGLVVAVLLLVQSLGSNNPLLQRLCGGNNGNCYAILASPAAKLTEEISWAEVGFSYFAGTWLALLVLGGSLSIRMMLAGLTLLSLPFTFYSLYYQARVARQWCRLCCAVLAVLWVEFGTSATYLTTPFSLPSFSEWTTLLGCLLFPVLGWVFVKPYLAQAQQADTLRQQLATFRRNRSLFESSLAMQPRYELLPESDAIRLGNPNAQQVLTIVSSPTCPPCARAHVLLKQWLARRDDLQVQIVFAVPDNLQDVRVQTATHILALYQENPVAACEALHSWFAEEHRDYKSWANRYPVEAATLINTPLPRHRDWCQRAAVSVTPTILLNGQLLPELYRLEDIQYFL